MADHVKLTQTKVRALKPRADPYIVRDDNVRGLFVEVSAASARYKLATTTRDRRTLKRTLGRTSDHTLEEARDWARAILKANRRSRAPEVREPPTLKELLDDHISYREARKLDERNTAGIKHRLNLHLGDWLSLRITDITPAMVRERHKRLSVARPIPGKPNKTTGGTRLADMTIENLRTIANGAIDYLNPVRGFKFTRASTTVKERGEGAMTTPEQVAEWWGVVSTMGNPTRARFNMLLLLSGMRSGAMKATRLEWLGANFIDYPKMKSGREFRLPLSSVMLDLVGEQAALARALGSPWLFPAHRATSGHLTRPRDDSLPIKQGHALRRTYITLAATTDIPQHVREMLVDHTTRGVHGTYLDALAMFPQLLAAQEQITRTILSGVMCAFPNMRKAE